MRRFIFLNLRIFFNPARFFAGIILTLGILAPSFNWAQQVPKMEDLVKVPTSPEAQAFTKYGNTPVNLFTGSPDINIPIVSLKGREIEVPVSLTYDASGIKVEQIATWIGLGWNLNAGGMVIRQTNGAPDDYLATPITHPAYFPFYSPTVKNDYEFVKNFTAAENSTYPPGELTRYFNFMKNVVNSTPKIEIQPDTYSFHALGISGTLIIDYTTYTAWCIEHPEIKAVPMFQEHGTIPIKNIIGWTITDASGNIFYFQLTEETYTYDNNSNDDEKWYNSGWLLTKIESKNKRDVIEFNYGVKTQWEQPQLAGRGDMRIDYLNTNSGIDSDIPIAAAVYKISQSELASIYINGKKSAQFIPGTQSRMDLAGRKPLVEIQTFDQNESMISRYKFIQTYFGNAGETDEKKLRLKLDKVEIHGGTISDNPQKYQFSYLSEGLPSRESYAQDFWGYYNGAIYNTNLIPYNYDYDKVNTGFAGANRKPNVNYCAIGTLTSITYPAGGLTELNYALHRSNEVSFSYKEDIYEGGASLINNGIGLTTRCEPDNVFQPKIVVVPLTIQITGSHVISISALGTTDASTSSHQRFIVIYNTRYRSGGLVNITPCDFMNNSIDHLSNTDLEIAYLARPDVGFTENIQYSFSTGSYKIVIINSDNHVTINAEVMAVKETADYNVGGLRTMMTLDRDENETTASKKYFYYNDLSTVPITNITESYLLDNSQSTSGLLQMAVNYEEDKSSQYYRTDPAPELITTGSLHRYSNNRTQAANQITYSVVTEIQFDNNGSHQFNGFIVNEFVNQLDNYISGYSKSAALNGRALSKKIYNSVGSLLNSEENYYTKRSYGSGSVMGFYFANITQWAKDVYVRSLISNPSAESFRYQDPTFTGGSENWTEQHCSDEGVVCSIFSDTNPDFHSILFTNHHSGSDCSDWLPITFNADHPAIVYRNSLTASGVTGVTWEHFVSSRNIQVCRPMYNNISCYNFGTQYQKAQYILPRYWTTIDSTRIIQYLPTGPIETITKNLYENTSHYQVTQVEQKDSKGVKKYSKIYYPHEMQASYPFDPIWSSLIYSNRIAESIKKESYLNAILPAQRLSIENTIYKSVGLMLVPDILQFATGTNPLESRIQFHQYDVTGNPTEVSRINDVKTSVLYGYNSTLAIAQIHNASINQVFHTSFEAGEEGGNSAVNDSRTGQASRMAGYSKVLSGLTANTNYVLSYWQKVNSVWIIQSQVVSLNSATTTYTISLTGQLDEVRFYPQNAQMGSFTYDTGMGLTSVTDPNNRSTFYQYDELGRLKLIKDDQGKILKTYQYNYKQ